MSNLEIAKSSNHKKISGNLGENLICYWLSRSGFEVTIVDHTGIDLVAYNPRNKQRLGITVKTRTRLPGQETDNVTILRKPTKMKGQSDRDKLLAACEAFGCEPWIGIYQETTDYGDLYLTSLENYDEKYRSEKAKQNQANDDWRMGKKFTPKYQLDPQVKHIRFIFKETNWNWN